MSDFDYVDNYHLKAERVKKLESLLINFIEETVKEKCHLVNRAIDRENPKISVALHHLELLVEQANQILEEVK